jgi:NADH dehydrogenase FAD-containing subunit
MLRTLLIISKVLFAAIPLIQRQLTRDLHAFLHRRTYKPVANPQNVVVIGGSYGGLWLAKQLANSLPTGYRVVLIEKRSHFNFTWIFPRVSVVENHEHKAFVPYGPGLAGLPEGSLLFKRGVANSMDEKSVTLQDGATIEYKFLAIATGSTGAEPWGSDLEDKREGIDAFQKMQNKIRAAKNLLVVGGGAVGVELAADVKDMYPEKTVTLVHSREKLLNSFGPKLHEYAMAELLESGVDVYLGERVTENFVDGVAGFVSLKSGVQVYFDLLVGCELSSI